MKKFIVNLLMIAMLLFTFSGCGVMFGGSKFRGKIIAREHPNANIYVNGNKIGQGTADGLFPRNRPLAVELRQEGCQTETHTYNNRFRTGNFILSYLMWGIPGIIVDLATGACYKPDHRNDPAIQQISSKDFTFTVDYSGCQK